MGYINQMDINNNVREISLRQTLLLKKHSLQNNRRKRIASKKGRLDENFINSNGIVSQYKLILIVCLITLSISTLTKANNTHWTHVRALTNYFSFYVLEQTELSIYDRGDNLDETYIEITTFSDMQDHLDNLVDFVQNYTDNGFANFKNLHEQNVDMQYYYTNGSLLKELKTFEEFKQQILTSDIRQLLLSLRVLYFQINFGDNEIIDQFKLIFDYQIYSRSMLRLDMSTKYKRKLYQGQLKNEFILRNLQRLFAIMLMVAYSIQARKLYDNTLIDKQFRKNSLYWCVSLILINFVAVISDSLAPMCAVMQLLPVFQNYDSSNTLTYNFNVNLRYAIPIVFRVIIPVYIILTGFILYSMLMYPGQYFDDFITGFFSYFYNNFQYGIYQIFMEIKSRGNIAYLLYMILYFYMVLVGSNLIPALFCTLIYQKMAEQELVKFIENKLELVVCPACKNENYQQNNYGLQISINSPKSPYLKSGTKLKYSHQKKQKTVKMFIEQTQKDIMSPTLSPIQSIKNKHKRAKNLIEDLKNLILDGKQYQNSQWANQVNRQIRNTLDRL